MILTDYYRFERIEGTKSKMRIDCTASTQSHPRFESLRNKAGSLFFYFGNVPDNFSTHAKRRADKAITKTENVSSIYVPNVELCLGYGDFRHTTDALLFIYSDDYTADNTPPTRIEIFVARGQKNNQNGLFNLLADGQFADEIEALRKQAINE